MPRTSNRRRERNRALAVGLAAILVILILAGFIFSMAISHYSSRESEPVVMDGSHAGVNAVTTEELVAEFG